MISLRLCRSAFNRLMVVLVVLSCLVASPTFSQETEDSQVFISGFNAYQQKDYASAIEKMNEVLIKYPDTPLRDMALFWLARSYFKTGNQQEAAHYLSQFSKEYPDNPLKGTVEEELLTLTARYDKGEILSTGLPPVKQPDRQAAQKVRDEKEIIASAKAEEAARAAAVAEATRVAVIKQDEEKTAAEKKERERLVALKAEEERIALESANREKAEQQRLAALKEEEARKNLEKAELDRIAAIKAEEARQATAAAEAARLAAAKEEEQRLASLKAEQEREKEKSAEQKLAAEKAEQQRLALLKAEEEQAAAAYAERLRLEQEKAEQERLAAIKAEEERKAAAEKAANIRLAEEKAAAENKERERIAAVKAEEGRIALEKAASEQIEQQRIAARKAEEARKVELEQLTAVKAEEARQAAVVTESARIAALKADREREEQGRAEQARVAAAKAEQERLAAVKAEEERKAAAEKAEQERLALIRAEEARQALIAAEAARVAALKAEEERRIAEKAEAARQAAIKAEEQKLTQQRAAEEKTMAEKLAQREKAIAEQERIAAAKAEEARQAAVVAESARIAALKAEREREEQERAEQVRVAAAKAEQERLAAVKSEEERKAAAEKAEQERLALMKAEEAKQASIAAEAARVAALKAEEERRIAEKTAIEAEASRLAAIKAEEQKLTQQRAAEEKIMAEKLALREKAIALYKSIIEKYPSSAAAGSAVAKLRELGIAVALPPARAPEEPLPENAQILRLEVAQFAGFEFNLQPRPAAHKVAERIRVPFEIINRGNGSDSFHLESGFPAAFNPGFASAVSPDTPITETPVMASGETFKGVVNLIIPSNSIDGLRINHPVKAASRFMAEASQSREVALTASAPLLRAVVKTDKTQPLPGEKIVYRVAVLNVGSTVAENVTFRMNFPPQLEPLDYTTAGFQQETKSALQLDGLQINSGESREFTVMFQLKEDSLAEQEILTRVELVSVPLKTVSAFVSNMAYVRPQRGILVRTGSDRILVIPGQTVTIPFVVTNTGNLREKFKIGSNVTGAQDAVVFHDINRDGIRQASEPVISELGPLSPKEEASVVMEVKTPRAAGDGTEGSVMLSFTSEGDAARSSLGSAKLLYSRPVLQMAMTGRDGRMKPGDVASFELAVTNRGSNLARVVELQSTWPEALELVAADPANIAVTNGNIVWRFKELGATEKRIIKVSFRVKPGTGVGTNIQVKSVMTYEDQLGNRY